MTPLDDKKYRYRLHDGAIVDELGRRVTIAGNLAIVQLLNERDQLQHALDRQIELNTPEAAPSHALPPLVPTETMYEVGEQLRQSGSDAQGIYIGMLNAAPDANKGSSTGSPVACITNGAAPQSSIEPTAWAIYDEPSGELIDTLIVKPERENGIRVEPLFVGNTAPFSDNSAAEEAMDEVERANGDAPHRAVDLATRIRVQFAKESPVFAIESPSWKKLERVEDFPRIGDYVLVWGVDAKIYNRHACHVAYIDDDDGSDEDLTCWMLECGRRLERVTHWAPLPSAPSDGAATYEKGNDALNGLSGPGIRKT